jgi:hypothetical protein
MSIAVKTVRTLAGLLLLVAVGCGQSATPTTSQAASPSSSAFEQSLADVKVYPVFVSSEILVGENRFLLGLLDDHDAPASSPKLHVHVDFYDLSSSSSQPVSGVEMHYIETIPGKRGIYEATATFDKAGQWGAAVRVSGSDIHETVSQSFVVKQKGSTPTIGAQVPASDTLTVNDAPKLSDITSDPHPDPSFYESSIAQALERHEPFVVVFATPKYCESEVCAPTLNIVKSVAHDFPKLTFIHVEIYDLSDTANLKPVPAVTEWGLPSEPWVFVVDGNGALTAKYEGTVTSPELHQALKHF